MRAGPVASTIWLAFMTLSAPAGAFFEADGDSAGVSVSANLQLSSFFADNPREPSLIYPNSLDEHTFLLGRLMADAWVGDHLALEFNLLQSLSSTTSPQFAAGAVSLVPVGRSDALRLELSNDLRASALMEVDQLFVRLSTDVVDLRLGRQPVGISSTLLFTPNDFFEPFSAQTFFREFKPGVDAVRADVPFGELSQVSAVFAAGFDPENLRDDDALAGFDIDESVAIVKVQTPLGEVFDGSVLGGRVKDRSVLGFGAQGELFEWLGVRAEGHGSLRDGDDRLVIEAAVEIDHRFESTLNLQLAYFHHGGGFSGPEGYLKALTGEEDPGLNFGRHYLAAAASHEVTPLLTAQAVLVGNLVDPSSLVSAALLYSVSDEASLSITGSLPFGAQTSTEVASALLPIPIVKEVKSEFGLFPQSLAVDIRMYF